MFLICCLRIYWTTLFSTKTISLLWTLLLPLYLFESFLLPRRWSQSRTLFTTINEQIITGFYIAALAARSWVLDRAFSLLRIKSRRRVENEANRRQGKKFHDYLEMSEPKQLQLQVEGLSNLMQTLEEHKGKRRTVMFIGAMNENGESWCPDCRDGL